MTALEDFLNVDMLGAGSSAEDSSSPDSTFLDLTMPPTPPQPSAVPQFIDQANVSDLFKFYFDQHMSEMAKQPVPFSFAQPLFAPAPPASSSSFQDPNFFAIDPALMNTFAPASVATKASSASAASKNTPPSASSVHADDEDDEGDEEENDEDIEALLARPVKLGGRGKAVGRKGTVVAGGIKKFGGQAVKDSDDPEDWRPTVEEYKKMSPKEKRQLRNKISARNFRVRRKEYITTLEGDVSERDKLIELIREELGATKLENEALRREVDSLKKALLEGRVELDLPPPAPLTQVTNKRATRSTKAGSSTPLAKANTRKDVARSGSSFWGGVAGSGGIVHAHTTLIPDFSVDPNQFQQQDADAYMDLQENMNPALNSDVFSNQTVKSVCEPTQPLANATNMPSTSQTGFDTFTDANPFTLRSADQYRMQLWTRLAREAGPGAIHTALGINAAHASPSSSATSSSPSPQLGITGLPLQTMPSPIAAPTPLMGLAARQKERYLDTPRTSENKPPAPPTPTLAEILSGKSARVIPSASSNQYLHLLKLPSTSTAASVPAAVANAKPEHAILATMASQTLLAKMRDAFWEAFAPSSSIVESKKKEWDADKVRRVLEGSAVVRVVDVDPKESAKGKEVASVEDPAAAIEESMRTLSLQRGASVASAPVAKDVPNTATATSAGVDALTGVFSGLRLASRTGAARS